ncbi:hybrid sensor histidine kinase/response regulator [Noviherbaspirillum soli]|uniref:hybrid sensor histidine kinase/response regulator n=1 Tax=Noviherbaspirillum soli TaxID=1064518 RepID=UPI00188B19DD|nr:hybrid sensor histidine kinase/response regulator [Noviherbaspirillum soli]
MSSSYQSKAQFEQEIENRLGLIPNLFLSTPAAPEVLQQFWMEGQAAYLDNPLPSLFKERLFVYLSRFCAARYCVIRHAGFLLGQGYPAGDRSAAPQSVEEVMTLLRYLPPRAAHLQAALQVLLAAPGALTSLPRAGEPVEQALFMACGAIAQAPERNQRARDAVQHVLGRQWSGQLFSLMAYIVKLHFWARLHPEIAVEPDLRAFMEREPELAQLLHQPETVESAPTPDASVPAGVQEDEAMAAPRKLDLQHQRFISLFSHELRNPAAAISAVSDMFQVVGLADDRLRSAGNILHRQIHALTQTLERMVDLSALLFGDVRLAGAPTAIDDVLAASLREMAPRLQEKNCAVELEATESRVFVMADGRRLGQMFESLLQHALKASPAGRPLQIGIAVQGQTVSIAFRDHGPGFAEQAHPLAEPAAGGSKGSMSVALTAAQAIAALHQGSLHAASPGPGQGQTVTVTLPLLNQAGGAGQGSQSAAGGEKAPLRVLAIEDNRDFAQLFRHMLEIMGCELDITSDARSGLRIAREIMPQLIFCDIGLPGDMDGFAFARALRADPALQHIPLVAVSGYNSPADVQRARDAGFDRLCGKPVKFADISEALSTFAAPGRRQSPPG